MASLQAGQTIGPYRILNQVGKGGMATVYRAYHSAMDRYVAIKFLPRELAESPEFVGRFRQEAFTIARLEHAHILPVHDFGEAEGHTYLVMRYLEAGTLADRLGEAALPLPEVDRIISQLAAALQYAHVRGIIHRDLKPSNVLLDASGSVFLTDFGIAKLLQADSRFTGTGTMIGTPAYMSPEQAQGRAVDQRSDIYSLGIILYEMVTGRVPFEADTPLAVVLKHVSEPLPLPSSVKPGLPASIEKVLLKALSKNPAERFADIGEFLDAWRAAVRDVPGHALPTAPPAPAPAAPTEAGPATRRRNNWGWLGLLGGGLGVVLGLLLCVGLICGSVWLAQSIMAGMALSARDGLTPGAHVTPMAAATEFERVNIPLEGGLPRSVTYGGLEYTVVEAVMDNEIQPDVGLSLHDGLFARLAVNIVNPTTLDAFPYGSNFRLRLADGGEYAHSGEFGWVLAPGSSETAALVFEVPAGAQWEGAWLVLSESDREPAELPLTGAVPPPAFPRALALPTSEEMIAPDNAIAYTLLNAALDLDHGVIRAGRGRRFLNLNIRLANLGYQSGLAVGPDFFRLLVDGVPLAPETSPIDVVDYQAALEGQVVFALPTEAAQVELQLGSVTQAEPAFVTLTLNMGGE